jgi:hypothetical protein
MMITCGGLFFSACVAFATLVSGFENSRYFPNEISIAVWYISGGRRNPARMGKIDHPKSSDGQSAINSSRPNEIALHVHLFAAAESFRAAFGT